jgi:hypothetical protein
VYVLQINVWPRFLFLFAIVLSVLSFTDVDYPCGIIKLFLSSCPYLVIVLSLLRFTDSDYPFGIFKLFFVLVVNIAAMKCCLLEVKQQSITISFLLSSVEHPFHI